MALKMVGRDFFRFMDDQSYWPEYSSLADGSVSVGGKTVEDWDILQEHHIVQIDGGTVHETQDVNSPTLPFEEFARLWVKNRDTATLIITIPMRVAEKGRARINNAINRLGGKIVN